MTQLMWPWHAMIKAHKVILSAHSLWINNFEKCLYQSKKEILEPSGKVWYPTRKKYFEGTTLRRKGVQLHLWWVRRSWQVNWEGELGEGDKPVLGSREAEFWNMNFTSDFLLVLIFKGSWEPQCPGAPEPREPWEPREPREPQTMNWNFATSCLGGWKALSRPTPLTYQMSAMTQLCATSKMQNLDPEI